jgi:hypothetical protein
MFVLLFYLLKDYQMNSTSKLPFLIVALLVVLMSGHETNVRNDATGFVAKKEIEAIKTYK